MSFAFYVLMQFTDELGYQNCRRSNQNLYKTKLSKFNLLALYSHLYVFFTSTTYYRSFKILIFSKIIV
jgi:hypothetical protein